ncbi:hypothetical protein GRX03_01045 [Halovenus sp. WSH3]|uniref:Uncharacterized protein n=1 Tax=Halovenus carboxidivorans TaxID=2692199 RepID=A0A6B0SYF2_9EURY|nr:hypothetical protein [Halovenus carboxidivorans]MXR50197.1 hypothetical protein [Halovenus carboxidivorans]
MSGKQVDTATTSLRITDSIRRDYEVKFGNTDIKWGDYYRSEDERNSHRRDGFLAEATLVDMFEKMIGEENVNWLGNEGEVDIRLFGSVGVEVKSRQDSTEYRSMILHSDLDNSDADMFINTVVHHDHFSDEPISVEVIGWMKKEEAYDKAEEVQFFGDDSVKYEVYAKDMNDIDEITNVLNLF